MTPLVISPTLEAEFGSLAGARLDGTHGLLQLAIRCAHDGRSVVHERRQRFPLRTTTPFYIDPADPGMAFIYVQNPTGGVFAGDRLFTGLTVGHGARVHLTTQSATKLYRMCDGLARHELRFDLRAGSYTEHIPDTVIPQAGSRYQQNLQVELEVGAALVTAETIAPGRRAYGERFADEYLELNVEVYRDGRELCADRLRFEPLRAPIDRPGLFGGADYLVSLLALAPESDVDGLAAKIDAALVEKHATAAVLPNRAGVIARALAEDAVRAERALRDAWGAARTALLGLPLPGRRK